MGNIHTCGPNKALIVSGGCTNGAEKKRTVVGGWAWAWWFVTDVQQLSLEGCFKKFTIENDYL